MTIPHLYLLLLLLVFISLSSLTSVKPLRTSPYLSPSTVLFPDYNKMINTLKIHIYNPPKPFTFTTPSENLFYTSLLNSSFVTRNPKEAHLFFVPFPSDMSIRSLSRFVGKLRKNFSYWDRTLGADHFFLSCHGINFAPHRNVLELKKNAVQISCCPTTSGNFIPHKDIVLPPVSPSPLALPHGLAVNETATYLGFMKRDDQNTRSSFIMELEGDSEFLIQSEPSDFGKSKFCLFMYGGDVSWLGEALRLGCVPVVITDRPIQDLPLIDVLKLSEIAVFVGNQGGVGVLKAALSGIDRKRYEQMKKLGVTASQHFVWNAVPQPFDSFHMVMYQLWLRRHTIRYARWEFR